MRLKNEDAWRDALGHLLPCKRQANVVKWKSISRLMPYIRDRVIVLKKEPFREHDRRYLLYGRDHGLLSAVARGTSLGHSKQAGHLEPFSETEVMLAKGAAFDKLAVARMITVPPVTRRLAFYAVCGAFTDLIIRLNRPGIADERIFNLLRELTQSLDYLPRDPTPERARLMLATVTLKLLDILGFAPIIHRSPENTTPVQSLALAAFMRESPLLDVWRVTGQTDVFQAAAAFVEEALKVTHLEERPRGPEAVHALLA